MFPTFIFFPFSPRHHCALQLRLFRPSVPFVLFIVLPFMKKMLEDVTICCVEMMPFLDFCIQSSLQKVGEICFLCCLCCTFSLLGAVDVLNLRFNFLGSDYVVLNLTARHSELQTLGYPFVIFKLFKRRHWSTSSQLANVLSDTCHN